MDVHILAIDDDPEFLLFLKLGLNKNYNLTTAQNMREAEVLLKANGIDLVLLDIGLGNENGLELLKQIKSKYTELDVVIVTGHKDPKFVVEAIRLGASDYLIKPFEMEELVAIVEKTAPYRVMREKNKALLLELNTASSKSPILGQAPAFMEVLAKAGCVKGHKANVLIEGESGTGKELLARHVHRLEGDDKRPFVAVNCAAIPENLLESELFGHEKGSFTGAHQRKIGKFELANGGDIFLDEVSCLKWDLQAKILRSLQEKEISRVGGSSPVQVDFRVIAATNDSLESLVDQGKFRRDLFHRLRVVPLRVPPLRERQEDISLLAAAFLQKFAVGEKWRFSTSALHVLEQYPWPGNIRELENLVQSLVILVPGPEIRREDLPEWVFRKQSHNSPSNFSVGDFALPNKPHDLVPLRKYMTQLEGLYIKRALELTKGDKSKAAALLDISRTRIYDRLKGREIN